MQQQDAITQKAKPLNAHDLEHRNLRLQLFIVRQLVLRLYADRHGDQAPRLVGEHLASLRESMGQENLHPAEQAMLLDETAEALADVGEHIELIQAGAL
ncbi:hypothetical protein LJR296_001421 [Cupriavidus necator]|uniref:hypothetical protein n=1 Tax=Cupriavidus necator TaxID=106590 RepID=UPI003ECE6B17